MVYRKVSTLRTFKVLMKVFLGPTAKHATGPAALHERPDLIGRLVMMEVVVHLPAARALFP
jgi:hypothetical protein